ncbi:MAG TPA: bifunctional 5,10-methylenetetrahydrofolate dehydrogenase/5,10-methenyltetrahydrofolate cyclohydrolase [Candidatus Angelobacter sp.]|nr:bifunctional 5,10-methylenetetrahydrofolate dehydrogenase/5,10-methenyltetrahydrofolate cyclohydrolase [Candidatus Angelobacter sp.]
MPTTTASILDGNRIAAQIRTELAEQVRALAVGGTSPGLAVIVAGEQHSSQMYIRNKLKVCQELGIHSETVHAPASVSTNELLSILQQLNHRDDIDGILVQLPLPPQVEVKQVLLAIDPAKDVDGFHPVNLGNLAVQRDTLAPCTAAGVMEILRRSHIPIAGRHAVILGRSRVVGKPLALLLLNHDATVTVCHSKTHNAAEFARQADILIAAVGHAGLVTETWVKPGATVIDVGINRITDRAQFQGLFGGDARREQSFAEKGFVVAGDVHPRVAEVAGAITPVPGGVGPLTIAMLMANTVKACRMRRGTAGQGGR